ncbi:MAG: signal peptidase I [Candidatus Levybacteria bacterium RIFCSPHIGHO2_02_FULL_40_29]|nr:MAG: signal peptidase I [Candidatus Levybacteria bacterium RIFCSPHIGHO2_02_FULL_40_29]
MNKATLSNKINGKFYRNAWLLSILAFIALLFYSVNNIDYPKHTVPVVVIGSMAFLFWGLSALLNRLLAKKERAMLISRRCLKIIFWLISISITVFYIITLYLFTTITVEGESMKDLKNGKTYKICRICKDIQRGQTITYYATKQGQSNNNFRYLGRVVGLPGENIKLKKGQLIVNDRVIKENYADWSEWSYEEEIIITLRESEFLALFDKRITEADVEDFIEIHKFNKNNYIGKVL